MYNFNIIKLDAIPSTNNYLKARHHIGKIKNDDLCWAAFQSEGRGQHQNKWRAAAGKNLTFSVYKGFSSFSATESFLLNTAVCAALVKALFDLGLFDIKIKWPNDILSDNKKIGGVLIENIIQSQAIVGSIIGIGLNVNQTHFDGLPHAGSVQSNLGEIIPVSTVLSHVLFQLRKVFDVFEEGDRTSFLTAYNASLWKRNETHPFSRAEASFMATLVEVDQSGRAHIRQGNQQIDAYCYGELKMSY